MATFAFNYNIATLYFNDNEEINTYVADADLRTYIRHGTNLRHHPVLGKKATSVSVTGAESVWSDDTDALHAVTVTGLYPVDLSREEEMLYIVVADHILDVFSPRKSE